MQSQARRGGVRQGAGEAGDSSAARAWISAAALRAAVRSGRKRTRSRRSYRASSLKRWCGSRDSCECRMAALVRHFGDEEDADRPCGKMRRVRSGGRGAAGCFGARRRAERELAQQNIRRTWAGGLVWRLEHCSESWSSCERISRDEFDALLDAMARGGLIEYGRGGV